MLVKVNNEFLDLNSDTSIDIEKRVKLFSEIEDVQGDFSYSFTIPPTQNNISIFSLFSANISGKTVYQKIPCTISNDDGQALYYGFLRVERSNKNGIDVSFYSGNSNWISSLSMNIREINFDSMETDWTESGITAAISNTSGVIFPLINTGAITTRSYIHYKVDDFHPFVYVKDIIKMALNLQGIKLKGTLLNDWRYQHLITSNSAAATPVEQIEERKTFVGKTSDQSLTTTPSKVTFHLESGDYYTGILWDTTNDRYTADYKMTVEISVDGSVDQGGEYVHFYIYKNGAEDIEVYQDNDAVAKTFEYSLEAGDYFELYAAVEAGTTYIFDYYITVRPTRIYRTFMEGLLPDVKASEFISSIFSIFNVVPVFNPITQTLNVDLFKDACRRDEMDISEYIDPDSVEEDYIELISEYGRLNDFKYEQQDLDDTEKYNKGSLIAYGCGQLDSLNENLNENADIISLPFVAALETKKNPFGSYLPCLNWRGLEETKKKQDSVSITDSSGPTFTASGFAEGDLVRVSNSTKAGYNGDWIVSSTTSTTFQVQGLNFIGNATADIVKLEITFEDANEQALLLALPNLDITDFSRFTGMYVEQAAVFAEASAYFFKPTQGLPIDDIALQSLSFGPVEMQNSYQTTLLDDYWRDFERILQDPLKLNCVATLPKSVFMDMDFSSPVRIKTDRINLRLFPEQCTGYKGGHLPCQLKLVKL